MSGTIVWIHEDCLSPKAPPLSAYPEAPAIFVFDDEYLSSQHYSLKRIAFVYECALETRASLFRGEPVDLVRRYAEINGADRIATGGSANPRILEQIERLRSFLPVEVLDPEKYVLPSGNIDLKRFSRYWSKIEKHVLARDV